MRYSSLLTLLLPFFLCTCGPASEEATPAAATPVGEPQTNHHSEEIHLTPSQFAAAGLTVGEVEQRPFGESIRTSGTVDVPPEYRAAISTYYVGFVRNLKLIAGDRVRKGQLLFTVENPDLIELQEELLQNRIDYAEHLADYERYATLAAEDIVAKKKGVTAKADLDRSQNRIATLGRRLAAIGIDAAKVSTDNLRMSIAIVAPFSGYVTEVEATTGQFLQPSEVALTMINTDHIHLELEVYEQYVGQLREEQELEYYLPSRPGIRSKAKIHRVGKTVEAEGRTVHVHADPDEDGELMKTLVVGMFVEANIQLEEMPLPALPISAVAGMGSERQVLVVTEEGADGYHFEARNVSVGRVSNGYVAILGGLETGRRVLTVSTAELLGEGGGHAH